jgi:multidrug resistance efflux pump
VLRLKGTTEAVRARAILTPLLQGQQVGSLTIIRLVPAGTHVRAGNLLAEFDRQAQVKEYLDKQAESDKLTSQVAEEQAKEVANRAKDDTELKQAESNLKKAELDLEKIELRSAIDAEKDKQTLEEAKATLTARRQTYDLKRKAARASIRILEIQRDRAQQAMLHAQKNADLMQIHSAIDGIVVLDTIWKSDRMGEVQEGDQVRPGEAFMHVIDPAVMQVRVFANQQDILSLQVGQQAKVRLDAYPDLVFNARLEQMAPVATTGNFSNKLRTFTVIFSVQGSAAELMPDLSAAVDVDLKSNPGKVGSS